MKFEIGLVPTIAVTAIIILASVLFFISQDAGEGEPDDNPEIPEAVVYFDTASQGNISFNCSVADTYAERAKGLMGVEYLANGSGMLFILDNPSNVSFWMKNVLIPLDMIFMDENYTVLKIAEAIVEPEGTSDANMTMYFADGLASYVLEINGGLSAYHGIVVGMEAGITFSSLETGYR